VPVPRGRWVSPRLILNRPYVVPSTGERRPTQLMDVGHLMWGSADPAARSYDGRTLVAGDGATVEVRIPWALLTFTDPSSHRVWVPRSDGTIATRRVGPLRIDGGEYDWDDWTAVQWRERRKAGWDAVARAFSRAERP
jgi:hypothetical protein